VDDIGATLRAIAPIGRSYKRQFFAVLHRPPVTSPVEAVRAAVVQERRSTQWQIEPLRTDTLMAGTP
jgi:hypothetical protein